MWKVLLHKTLSSSFCFICFSPLTLNLLETIDFLGILEDVVFITRQAV